MSVIIGILSGIISGMGIGGGAILIPALILINGIDQKLAQGINLVYFLPTAIFALFVHIKNKNVILKTAIIIGICGALGAVAGSLIAMKLDNDLLRRLFGIFLGLIGIREIFIGIRMKKEKEKAPLPKGGCHRR